MQDAQNRGFNVGRSVERIHKQPARAGIERQRHGIDREVAPPKILDDGGGAI